jgi:hypothetical protein
MSATQTMIQQAAAKNKELLRVLAETDHAIPDLVQQKRFIADLEAQAAQSNKRIKDLDKKRAKELKDHEKYRDSVMRRFAYKATGKREKYESKAQKEEAEYFDVLQEELREKELNANIVAQLQDAYKARQGLEAQAEKHASMQRELDSLYNAIFAGSTPEFPEEDAKEQAENAALQQYHDCRTKTEAETQALRFLNDAQQRMSRSLAAVEEALRHSRVDMFGGGTLTDMMERNALSRAEIEVQEARMRILQAQRASPFVGDIPPVEINQGHLMRDVFFDNVFTDMAFHDEIKKSKWQIERAFGVLNQMATAAKGRHTTLQMELRGREAALQEARVALQKAREQAFEKVAGAA